MGHWLEDASHYGGIVSDGFVMFSNAFLLLNNANVKFCSIHDGVNASPRPPLPRWQKERWHWEYSTAIRHSRLHSPLERISRRTGPFALYGFHPVPLVHDAEL